MPSPRANGDTSVRVGRNEVEEKPSHTPSDAIRGSGHSQHVSGLTMLGQLGSLKIASVCSLHSRPTVHVLILSLGLGKYGV